jgi:hypothetical protein
LRRARCQAWFYVRVLLVEPYVYTSKRIKKPPDGSFYDEAINLNLVLWIFAYIYLFYGIAWIKAKYKQRGSEGEQHQHHCKEQSKSSDPGDNSCTKQGCCCCCKPLKIFATDAGNERGSSIPPVSFRSDGISFAVDNCASTHVCSVKELFISPLVGSGTCVLTANGPGDPLLKGTIRISWEDDYGIEHTHELQDVLYSPNSNVNIISIGRLGEMFGANDPVPNDDSEGTWIKSSCSYSTFTWDHSKHSKRIVHGQNIIPEVQVNSNNSTFASYLSKIRRVYNDLQHYAFLTDVSDDLTNKSRALARDFQVSDSVKYNEGKGNVHTGKYL